MILVQINLVELQKLFPQNHPLCRILNSRYINNIWSKEITLKVASFPCHWGEPGNEAIPEVGMGWVQISWHTL